MRNGTVTCEVLLELYKNEKVALRVVSWNNLPPVLEKRTFFEKGGQMRTGKAKGLTFEDLSLLDSRLQEILDVMGEFSAGSQETEGGDS